jgi:hypothetical protein
MPVKKKNLLSVADAKSKIKKGPDPKKKPIRKTFGKGVTGANQSPRVVSKIVNRGMSRGGKKNQLSIPRRKK